MVLEGKTPWGADARDPLADYCIFSSIMDFIGYMSVRPPSSGNRDAEFEYDGSLGLLVRYTRGRLPSLPAFDSLDSPLLAALTLPRRACPLFEEGPNRLR